MKNKTLFGGVALSLSFLMVAGAMAGVSGKKVAEAKATPLSYNITKLIVIDESSWNFRTLWTDNYGFSSGYTVSDFEAFVHDYYVTDLSASWDKEGSTKGYKRVSDGFNLCAGGTSGTYEFVFPEWVEYCSIQVENNGNSRYVNYLNNLKDTNDQVIGDGHSKEVSIYANSTGGWPAIGSAATTTAFDTTVSIIAKTDASTQIATDSVQMSKYDHIDGYVKSGYTFDAWYTDAALTTPFSGLVLNNTSLYAKMTENPHTYKVKFGSNAAVSMTVQSPGGYYAQYKVDTAVNAGDTISFLVDDEVVSADADSLGSNNYYDGKVIESAASAAVWLKLTNTAGTITYSYWIGGRTHDYFFKNGVGSTGVVPMEPNPENANEYYALGVVCQNNWSVQKYTDRVSNFYYDAASDGRWELGGSNNTIARSGGVFDVYYKVDINTCYFQYASSTAIKVRLDSGSYQTMTDDTAHIEDPTFNKQYKYTATVSGGEAVHFFAYDNSTNYELPASADTTALNNINTESGTIITGGTVDIYLKRKLAGGWEYFVSGRTANYYLMVGTIGSWTYYPLSANPSQSGEYMATSVSIAADNYVRLYATAPYDGTLNEHSTGKWTVDDSKIKCGAAGTYNIYYTPSDSNKLYFGNPTAADVEATAYADLFLETLKADENPICTAYGDTAVADLQSAWLSLSGTFASKSTEAKNILKSASASGAASVNKFADLYDWIYSHYATDLAEKGANFASRDVVASRSPYVFSPFNTQDTSTVVAIVVIVSLISVTSIGAFFYVRRRKHN